jgi:GNAT superfamily N-acetyltransferase
MPNKLVIDPLGRHPQALAELVDMFEAEWPEWYRCGRGSAQADLQAYSNQNTLPVGVLALSDEQVCGVAALKAESIASHPHLSPWAAAGLVKSAMRGQGIGLQLLLALEEQARLLKFKRIYCATSTADTLLERAGWQVLERIRHEGKALTIYEKLL